MSSDSFRIWSNVALPEPALSLLRDGVSPHELIFAKNVESSVLIGAKSDPECQNSDIAFGQPDPQDVMQSARLRWIHLTSAGYTRYDRDEIRTALSNRGAVATNSSSVYDEPCAQHLLAMMLAFARRLPEAVLDQAGRHWNQMPIRGASRLLTEDSVLIIGFGAIARRLVELLAPLRMSITAVRRTPSGNEPVRVLPISQIDQLLPLADHVINILPAAANTRNFFDAARFSRTRPGAFFYNIGRGDTVNQPALSAALESNHLAAAYLDVTTPEPLPPADPLWSAPRCYITPHTAGGHATEYERLVRHFLENLRRFTSREQLKDRILQV